MELQAKFNLIVEPNSTENVMKVLIKNNVRSLLNGGIKINVLATQDVEGDQCINTTITFSEVDVEYNLSLLCKELLTIGGVISGDVEVKGIPFNGHSFPIVEYPKYLSDSIYEPHNNVTEENIKELINAVIEKETVTLDFKNFKKFVMDRNSWDSYRKHLSTKYNLSFKQLNDVCQSIFKAYSSLHMPKSLVFLSQDKIKNNKENNED